MDLSPEGGAPDAPVPGASNDLGRLGPALLAYRAEGFTAGSRERRSAGKHDRATQEQLDQAVWRALDEGASPDVLARVLAEGGRTDAVRNGLSPLWAAVASQRLELARVLVEAGASVDTTGPGGASLWAAIAPRDDIEEGQRLLDLLGGKRIGIASDFFRSQAHNLLWWWASEGLKHGGQVFPSPPQSPRATSGEHLGDWVLAALHGPEPLLEAISKAWGIDPGQPGSLADRWGVGLACMAWEEVARRDNVAMAQRLMSFGWGPPRPCDYAVPTGIFQNRSWASWAWAWSPGWYFLTKRAQRLWHWWTSVPELKEEIVAQARREPDKTLAQVRQTVPALDLLAGSGVDLGGRDGQGLVLLHHLMASRHMTLAMARWFLQHRPQDYHAQAHDGRRPLDMPVHKKADPGLRPRIAALLLDARLDRATGGGRGGRERL